MDDTDLLPLCRQKAPISQRNQTAHECYQLRPIGKRHIGENERRTPCAGAAMSYDGREIVNFILDECDRDSRQVTNLALQKILFFCHAWSLIELKKPLIKQSFEAWEFGPVLQGIYHEFKKNGNKSITQRSTKINKINGKKEIVGYAFDSTTETLLRKVVDFYSRLRPSELVDISHVRGGPWHKTWYHNGLVNPGMRISDSEIEDFYSTVRSPYPAH